MRFRRLQVGPTPHCNPFPSASSLNLFLPRLFPQIGRIPNQPNPSPRRPPRWPPPRGCGGDGRLRPLHASPTEERCASASGGGGGDRIMALLLSVDGRISSTACGDLLGGAFSLLPLLEWGRAVSSSSATTPFPGTCYARKGLVAEWVKTAVAEVEDTMMTKEKLASKMGTGFCPNTKVNCNREYGELRILALKKEQACN
uniref:Uncharacterized protein n=1 Tax=Oryza rufipogon TaxID=4529 RepID=A0A0E0R234_ORYRU